MDLDLEDAEAGHFDFNKCLHRTLRELYVADAASLEDREQVYLDARLRNTLAVEANEELKQLELQIS